MRHIPFSGGRFSGCRRHSNENRTAVAGLLAPYTRLKHCTCFSYSGKIPILISVSSSQAFSQPRYLTRKSETHSQAQIMHSSLPTSIQAPVVTMTSPKPFYPGLPHLPLVAETPRPRKFRKKKIDILLTNNERVGPYIVTSAAQYRYTPLYTSLTTEQSVGSSPSRPLWLIF